MSLKMAHRVLGHTGARIQLIPSDPYTGLARWANRLGQLDLVVVSARLDPLSLARAWFYVPRLLHDGSQAFVERPGPGGGPPGFEPLARDHIERLAAAAAVQRAA